MTETIVHTNSIADTGLPVSQILTERMKTQTRTTPQYDDPSLKNGVGISFFFLTAIKKRKLKAPCRNYDDPLLEKSVLGGGSKRIISTVDPVNCCPGGATREIRNPLEMNNYIYSLNNSVNRIDPSGEFSLIELNATIVINNILMNTGATNPKKKSCDCPDGEWSSFSPFAMSLFFGGGGTVARTTYRCKSSNKVCEATSICFGGGPILAAGIGIDFGGYPKFSAGVSNVYWASELKNYSSGIFLTGGPFSETLTGSSKNIGVSKSWGGGVAYITCTNTLMSCN